MNQQKVSVANRSFVLGEHKFNYPIMAAPMAGYTRLATRILYRRFGASLNVSEMVNARLVAEDNPRTLSMLQSSPLEKPLSIQVFGAETKIMEKDLPKIVDLSGAISIDLNMGCPVKKISSNGFGVSLMAHPQKVYDLVSSMVNSSPVPITVKMRSGPTVGEESYLQVGEMCQKAGATAVTLHPRTRKDKFEAGTCNWDHIGRLKRALDIPVMGNGDILCVQDGIRMIEETDCDGLMIGRGAVGNPWIFEDFQKYFEGESSSLYRSLIERLKVAREHFQLELQYAAKSEGMFRQVRKSLPEYLKGTPNYIIFRESLCNCESNTDVLNLLDRFLKEA